MTHGSTGWCQWSYGLHLKQPRHVLGHCWKSHQLYFQCQLVVVWFCDPALTITTKQVTSYEMNEVMWVILCSFEYQILKCYSRRLTLATIICLPLTFLTGYFVRIARLAHPCIVTWILREWTLKQSGQSSIILTSCTSFPRQIHVRHLLILQSPIASGKLLSQSWPSSYLYSSFPTSSAWFTTSRKEYQPIKLWRYDNTYICYWVVDVPSSSVENQDVIILPIVDCPAFESPVTVSSPTLNNAMHIPLVGLILVFRIPRS